MRSSIYRSHIKAAGYDVISKPGTAIWISQEPSLRVIGIGESAETRIGIVGEFHPIAMPVLNKDRVAANCSIRHLN